MLLRTRSGVTDTRDHWTNRTRWAGGRRQLTFHLIFDDSTLADATTGMREALVPLEALDVVHRSGCTSR